MPTILPLESLSISPRAQGQHKRDEYFRCSVNPQHRHISRQFGIISSEQCNAMKYLLQLVYDKIPRSRLGDFMVPLMKTRYWPLLPENTGVLERRVTTIGPWHCPLRYHPHYHPNCHPHHHLDHLRQHFRTWFPRWSFHV